MTSGRRGEAGGCPRCCLAAEEEAVEAAGVFCPLVWPRGARARGAAGCSRSRRR